MLCSVFWRRGGASAGILLERSPFLLSVGLWGELFTIYWYVWGRLLYGLPGVTCMFVKCDVNGGDVQLCVQGFHGYVSWGACDKSEGFVLNCL